MSAGTQETGNVELQQIKTVTKFVFNFKKDQIFVCEAPILHNKLRRIMIGRPQSPCYPTDEAADCAYLSVNGPSQRTASFSVLGLNTLAAVTGTN